MDVSWTSKQPCVLTGQVKLKTKSLLTQRRYLDANSTSFERYGRQMDVEKNNVVCLLGLWENLLFQFFFANSSYFTGNSHFQKNSTTSVSVTNEQAQSFNRHRRKPTQSTSLLPITKGLICTGINWSSLENKTKNILNHHFPFFW